MTGEEDQYTETFSPHLWRQRRSFILEMLQRFKIETVLDYGCGEAAVLSYLIPPNAHPITKISGLDISDEVLKEAVESCTPWQSDFDQLRDHPLVIDIYKGSVGIPDDRFKGIQGIVCTEVIEHVYPDVLNSFLGITLGIYQPDIMIVTTPNAEYNVNFPDLKYGTSQSEFRHDDHKFEWTRAEFQSWCDEGASKYGYDVEYHGIGLLTGKYDELENGHCTQACIFIRRSSELNNDNQITSHGTPHELVKHIEFPYYNAPPQPKKKIIEELLHYIEVLCVSETYAKEESNHRESSAFAEEDSCTLINLDIQDWSTFDLKEHIPTIDSNKDASPSITNKRLTQTVAPLKLPISNLWDISRLRQMCGTMEIMLNALSLLGNQDYELLSNDTLLVKKAFEIDWDDSDHLSASTFSSHDSW